MNEVQIRECSCAPIKKLNDIEQLLIHEVRSNVLRVIGLVHLLKNNQISQNENAELLNKLNQVAKDLDNSVRASYKKVHE